MGTHGQLRGSAKERDSHHIPQYLLLEFLSNRVPGVPALPHPTAYSGVETESGAASSTTAARRVRGTTTPSSTEASGGSPGATIVKRIGALDLDRFDLDEQRGRNMPAISLARPTHRRGRLHISAKPDERESAGKRPAEVVREMFLKAVKARATSKYEVIWESVQPVWKRTVLQEKLVRRDGTPVLKAAAVETYQQVKNDMLHRLASGLASLEVAYFNRLRTVTSDVGASKLLDESSVKEVVERTTHHVETTMGGKWDKA